MNLLTKNSVAGNEMLVKTPIAQVVPVVQSAGRGYNIVFPRGVRGVTLDLVTGDDVDVVVNGFFDGMIMSNEVLVGLNQKAELLSMSVDDAGNLIFDAGTTLAPVLDLYGLTPSSTIKDLIEKGLVRHGDLLVGDNALTDGQARGFTIELTSESTAKVESPFAFTNVSSDVYSTPVRLTSMPRWSFTDSDISQNGIRLTSSGIKVDSEESNYLIHSLFLLPTTSNASTSEVCVYESNL